MTTLSTLSSALTNATSVMGHTDTQYLTRQFEIVTDVAQRASFEQLLCDFQAIFHHSKEEENHLDSAKRIVVILGLIASKQGTPEEQAHFKKIQAVVMQSLTNTAQAQGLATGAKYFQERLTLLLYARETMVTQAVEAQTGISYIESTERCLGAFDKVTPPGSEGRDSFAYKAADDLSTLALSVLFRIQSLCEIEGDRRKRPLTRAEIFELESYCLHEDPQVRQVASDFALLRKRIAANTLFTHAGKIAGETVRIGAENDLLEPSLPALLSPYYPSYEKFVKFEQSQAEAPSIGMSQEQIFAIRYRSRLDLYEEHLTLLPVLNFAYRYFYNELNQLYSLAPKKAAFTSAYRKAYEGRPLPSPDEFRLIIAVFPKPISLSAITLEVEDEKRESKQDRVETKVVRESKRVERKRAEVRQKPRRDEAKRSVSPVAPVVEDLPPRIELQSVKVDDGKKDSVTVVQTELPVVAAKAALSSPLLEIEREALPFDTITYDPRVSLWFNNPDDCLALPQYASLGDVERDKVVWKHAFPEAFDQLIGSAYSLPEPWKNRTRKQTDILYTIPGEVEVIGSTRRIRGLFQYCFGSKDQLCYHRCFKEVHTRNLLRRDQYSVAFDEIDFPPLSSLAATSSSSKPKNDQTLVYEESLNTYAVKDNARGLIFRAFKIRDLS
jgi:hypothetical protein